MIKGGGNFSGTELFRKWLTGELSKGGCSFDKVKSETKEEDTKSDNKKGNTTKKRQCPEYGPARAYRPTQATKTARRNEERKTYGKT